MINEEWTIIRVIKDFLKKLFILIKVYESKESTFDLSLPYSNYILSLFKCLKSQYKDNLTFTSIFNSRWAKINKYYKLTNKTLAYVTVIVLHPSYKWKWIKKY